MVSVSSDESLTEASSFAKEIRATFPVIHDPKSTVTNRFGVVGIPANVVIDRSGKVLDSVEGPDVARLEKDINLALTRKK